MKTRVALIDYKMGNLFSIEKRLKNMNCEIAITASPQEIIEADKLILPGVGHFGSAMKRLNELNLITLLNEQVLGKKKPILGICLGMQLLAQHSEEGEQNGLGWIDAKVKKFHPKDTVRNKVPHTGWSIATVQKESILFKSLPKENEFYFVHSFYFSCNQAEDILTTSVHEHSFVSAVEKNNIFGVQFHPEKSHEIGNQLLKNFIQL